MIKLTLGDIFGLSNFNDHLFLSKANENRVWDLEKSVADARDKLLKLIKELDFARQQPAIVPISDVALIDFFSAHPSMSILYDDGLLTLKSENQSVAFHTKRERNAFSCNNDIIYVTLPLYSFKLVFYPDGSIVGSAEKARHLEEMWAESFLLHYGHPHTQHNGSSRTFSSLCNGNNRFIQDWNAMRNGGSMDGNITMRILSQAAIWMESANISDMYGTKLAWGIYASGDMLDGIDVDGLLFGSIPIADGVPALKFIYDTYGPRTYRMALWPLWMLKHFYELSDCLTSCESMYQAALYDSWLILKYPDIFGAVHAAAMGEFARILPMSLRCYKELAGYYPGLGSKNMTLAERKPELFSSDSNFNNMEENNVASNG